MPSAGVSRSNAIGAYSQQSSHNMVAFSSKFSAVSSVHPVQVSLSFSTISSHTPQSSIYASPPHSPAQS